MLSYLYQDYYLSYDDIFEPERLGIYELHFALIIVNFNTKFLLPFDGLSKHSDVAIKVTSFISIFHKRQANVCSYR